MFYLKAINNIWNNVIRMAIFLPFCSFLLFYFLVIKLSIDVVSCPLFITKQLLKKYSVNYLLFLLVAGYSAIKPCFNLSKIALLHLANFIIHLNVIRKLWNLGNIKVKNLLITSHKKSQQTWGLQRQFWSGRAKKSGQDKIALGFTVLLFIMHLHSIVFILEP